MTRPVSNRRTDLAVVVGLVVAVAVLTAPMFVNPWSLPITSDPDAFNDLSHVAVLTDAMRRFVEYPLWNPYYGGGMPWAGSVYNPGLSLQSLLFVGAGEVLGIKLWAATVLALGTVGMYLSLRTWLTLSPSAAVLGALVYATAPWMAGVLDGGDYDLFGMFALPFMLIAFRWRLEGRRRGLLMPVCLAVGLADAAKWWPFIVAACVLWLALACRDSLPAPHLPVRRMVFTWGLAIGVGVLLSASKLLPLIRLMSLDQVPQMVERQWELCYTSWRDVLRYAATAEGRGNLQIGVGVPGLVLACVGLWSRRMLWAVALLFVALAVVGMGPQAPLPVVELASRVPLMRDMGSYGMYASLPMLVCVVVLAAAGVERVLQAAGTWPARRLVYGVLACGAAVVLTGRAAAQADSLASLFGEPPAPVRLEPFRQVAYAPLHGVVSRYRETPAHVTAGDQYRNLRRGVGTITWLGNMVFPEHARPQTVVDEQGRELVAADGRGDAFAAEPTDAVRIASVRRTYNTIAVQVDAARPATLVLNTNCLEGWAATTGRVTCRDGLLAVELGSAMSGPIELRFHDRLFAAGCVVSALTAAAWLAGGLRSDARAVTGPVAS